MRRRKAFLLCLILTAGIFAGCGSEQEGPYIPTGDGLTWDEVTTPTSGVTEQVMSLAYYSGRSLNPYQSTDLTNRALFSLLYQSLFVVDGDYTVSPLLCKSYSISRDMRSYTFYLEEATFSDGTPLTAMDVAASLTAAKKSGYYSGRFGFVKEITAADGAVTVDLETPYENFLLLLDVPIVKKDQVSVARPLGTGPYYYEELEENGLRLRRRKDWWCAARLPITAERIRLVEGENAAQLRDEFEFSGLSLVCTDPGAESYVDFHSDYELWDSENGIFLYLACNSDSPVLGKKRIRGALTYAIDRNRIADEYYRGFATGTALPASPQSPFYSAVLAKDITFNTAKLKQAVTEANLEDNSLVFLVNTDDGIRLRAARIIAQALNECGLKVTMSELDGEAYRKALEEGKFDLYLGQTKLSANMDLSAFFDKEGSLNFGGISDPATYALCLDSLANSGNYYTLHQKILEDGMLCPVLFRSNAIFTQRGAFAELNPTRDSVFFYTTGKTLADALIVEE